MPLVFKTPSVVEKYGRHRLFSRVGLDVGVTVLKEDGFYVSVRDPDPARIDAAQEVYLGGYVYDVSDAVGVALTAAGYGDQLHEVLSAGDIAKLAPLNAALALSADRPAICVFEGTSITEGTSLTGDYTSTFRYQFLDKLRTKYNLPGGIGYIPAYYEGGQPTNPIVVNLDANTGGTSVATKNILTGLGARAYNLKFGAALTLSNVQATSFRIWFQRSIFGETFKVLIDGTQVAAAVSTGTSGGSFTGSSTWSSGPLAPGLHTIKIQTNDTAGFQSTIEGIEVFNGDESRGIRCYDSGKNGASAIFVTMDSHHKAAYTVLQPDAIFVDLMANDAVFGGNAAAYQTALAARMAETVAAVAPKKPSFIFLMWPEPNNPLLDTWANYKQAMRNVAATIDNSILLDFSYGMGQTVAADIHEYFSDTVHPNNAGATYIAGELMTRLELR